MAIHVACRGAGATGAAEAASPAALCLRGHAGVAMCRLLPLRYLIIPFEIILSL